VYFNLNFLYETGKQKICSKSKYKFHAFYFTFNKKHDLNKRCISFDTLHISQRFLSTCLRFEPWPGCLLFMICLNVFSQVPRPYI
jgi:hypothetical protein